MNAQILALLHLAPDEEAAVPLLHQFAAAHPGVMILTPHNRDEPWRAEIREGAVPGESRTTSAFPVAHSPSGLLAKLEVLFDDPPSAGDAGDTG